MAPQEKHLYDFGPFQLDATKRLLLRDGRPLPLAPRVIETLLVLVENHGQLVEKDDLMKAVWPDTFFVEEANLAVNSSEQRSIGVLMLKSEPVFDPLRTHPRFLALVRRVRLEN